MKKLIEMKKYFAFILALTLILGMSTAAFAEPNGDDNPSTSRTDQASIIIEKDFKLLNGETISPAETFDFTITKEGAAHSQYTLANMPMFDPATFSISFAQGEATATGDTNSHTLTLPTYTKVGVFTYKIKETAKSTAGLTYDSRDLILTVYVENASDGGFIRYATLHDSASENKMTKVKGFHNGFDSGNLAVTKNVTGNMGDKDFAFGITVTLKAPTGKNITSPAQYSGGQYTNQPIAFENGIATLPLLIKHGHTITFSNLPYGTTWTVAENDYTGADHKYDAAAIDKSSGTIEATLDTSTITNNKNSMIDTGINLDNLPYVMIIVVAAGGLVGFTLRRRYTNNK